jgi:predicted transcriptional regulator
MTATKAILFVEIIEQADDKVQFKITDEGRQVIESIKDKLV